MRGQSANNCVCVLYPVDDVVDDSDDNEETEADTENDSENEEDEKDHCTAVILATHSYILYFTWQYYLLHFLFKMFEYLSCV